MSDPRMETWARTLVTYSLAVQPGDTVAIQGGTAAAPLLRAVYAEVVRAGGRPVVVPFLSGTQTELLRNGNDEQLQWVSPIERWVREEADCVLTIGAEENTRSSSGRASMMRDTVPWPIIAYARGPRPVPRNMSCTSLRRTTWLLTR